MQADRKVRQAGEQEKKTKRRSAIERAVQVRNANSLGR